MHIRKLGSTRRSESGSDFSRCEQKASSRILLAAPFSVIRKEGGAVQCQLLQLARQQLKEPLIPRLGIRRRVRIIFILERPRIFEPEPDEEQQSLLDRSDIPRPRVVALLHAIEARLYGGREPLARLIDQRPAQGIVRGARQREATPRGLLIERAGDVAAPPDTRLLAFCKPHQRRRQPRYRRV